MLRTHKTGLLSRFAVHTCIAVMLHQAMPAWKGKCRSTASIFSTHNITYLLLRHFPSTVPLIVFACLMPPHSAVGKVTVSTFFVPTLAQNLQVSSPPSFIVANSKKDRWAFATVQPNFFRILTVPPAKQLPTYTKSVEKAIHPSITDCLATCKACLNRAVRESKVKRSVGPLFSNAKSSSQVSIFMPVQGAAERYPRWPVPRPRYVARRRTKTSIPGKSYPNKSIGGQQDTINADNQLLLLTRQATPGVYVACDGARRPRGRLLT